MPDSRRIYTPEFKVAAVKLVTEQGRSGAEAAHFWRITEKILRQWKKTLVSKGSDAFPRHGHPPAAEAEIRHLQEQNKRPRYGAGHPKKSDGPVRPGVAVIYAFLDQHQDSWPVRVMVFVLEVSPSGYYAWKDRPLSPRQHRRDRLLVEITAVHEQVKHRYGSPRLHAERKAQGHGWCINSVAAIMRQARIRAKTARQFKHTTDANHSRPVAENVLDRQLTATRPNESWVADLT